VPESVPGGLGVVADAVSEKIEGSGETGAAKVAFALAAGLGVEESLIAQDVERRLRETPGHLDETPLALEQKLGGADVRLVPGEAVALVEGARETARRGPEKRGHEKRRSDRKILGDAGVGVRKRALEKREGLSAPLLPEHVLGPREKDGEKTVTAKTGERAPGVPVQEELVHLIEETRRRDRAEKRTEFRHGRGRIGIDGEPEFGLETNGAEHAHRILTVALGGLADEAQAGASEIGESAHPVAKHFVAGVVVEGVDREVAAVGVVALGSVDVVAEKAPLVGDCGSFLMTARRGAERRDLHVMASEIDVHEAETTADQARVAEDPAHLFGMGVGGDVEVLRMTSEKEIAEGSSDDVGGVPALPEAFEDLEGLRREGLTAESVFRTRDKPGSGRRFVAVPWRRGIQNGGDMGIRISRYNSRGRRRTIVRGTEPGSLRLEAQDSALSRRRQGFESPRERHVRADSSGRRPNRGRDPGRGSGDGPNLYVRP
jgi:hypothetical protein